MAKERPKFDEQSVKDGYPGPGEYEAAKRENNQIGLASHFAMAVGRDFANMERLKLMVDRNLVCQSAAIPTKTP